MNIIDMAKVLCLALHHDVLGAGQDSRFGLALYGFLVHSPCFRHRAQVFKACTELFRTQHSPALASSCSSHKLTSSANHPDDRMSQTSKATATSAVQAAMTCQCTVCTLEHFWQDGIRGARCQEEGFVFVGV